MPTIRQRVARVLLGSEIQGIEETARVLSDAIRLGPSLYSPEELFASLSEQDSYYVDTLLEHLK